MNQENVVMLMEELPQYQQAPLQHIEPSYKKVLLISSGLLFLLLVVIGSVAIYWIDELQSGLFMFTASIATLLAVVINITAIQIGFRNKAWAIREKDIIFRTGWLFQSTHVIPFIKIQHCTVRSGPLERRFGLASIRLHTAASHDIDISINGLKQEAADQLKEFIMEKIAAYASPGV